MKYFAHMASMVLDEADNNPGVALKLVGETSLITRALIVGDESNKYVLRSILERILNTVHSDTFLKELDRALEAPALMMPYVAIRDYCATSVCFEAALQLMSERGQIRVECIPFKEVEFSYILYLAGRGPAPLFGSARWGTFCERVYEFNVHDAYIYTHRYMYSRDFGLLRKSPDATIKAQLLRSLARGVLWHNYDLCYEICFCLLLEQISEEETVVLARLVPNPQEKVVEEIRYIGGIP